MGHGRTETEAQEGRRALAARLEAGRLELPPAKTTRVSCKDEDRRGTYPHAPCEGLGAPFRPRRSQPWQGQCFIPVSPAVAETAGKAMRAAMHRGPLP